MVWGARAPRPHFSARRLEDKGRRSNAHALARWPARRVPQRAWAPALPREDRGAEAPPTFELAFERDFEGGAGLGADIFFTHSGVQFDENQSSARFDLEDAEIGDDEIHNL